MKLASFFVLIAILNSKEQTLNGIIYDKLTKTPIPYVHISLSNNVGTISNKDGEFRLIWGDFTTEQQNLHFSAVGYRTLTLPLSDSILNTYLEVKLMPSITILDDVLITSEVKADSAILIMQKVLKNINKNYPKHKYGIEAFYREANISDDVYSRLIEAQIFIADKGYNKPIETTEMNVLQMRKAEDNRNISWRQSLFEWLYMKNGVFKTLANDRVKLSTQYYNFTEFIENKNGWIQFEKRGQEGSIRFLTDEFIEGCNWEIKDIIKNENDTTYVLKYRVISKNEQSFFGRIGQGIVYVAKDDWGVKEIRSEVEKPEGTPYLQLDYTLKDSRAYYKTIIRYQKYQGNYYLSYIKSESIGTNSQSLFGGRDRGLFKETKGRLGKIYQENELFVTRILPYKKVSKKNKMDKEDDLYNVDVKNDEAFWATYNYPMLNPLTDKMKNDLKNSYGELFIKD